MKVELKENPVHELMRNKLDDIYKTATEITVAYNSQYIPMNALWELLNKSRLGKNKELKGLDKNWNKVMDNIYIASKRHCNENKLEDRLPMIIFKTYIDVVKDNLG